MKKLIIAFLICVSATILKAQETITPADVKVVTGTVMANFTDRVSFAYAKGISIDDFRKNLCGDHIPMKEGEAMIEAAYNNLAEGLSREEIIKNDEGKIAGAAFVKLYPGRCDQDELTGPLLFGMDKYVSDMSDAKQSTGCKWYQFFCLAHDFLDWIMDNWSVIHMILIAFGISK